MMPVGQDFVDFVGFSFVSRIEHLYPFGMLSSTVVELIDIAADLWWVRVVGSATGSEATPFDATVT